MRACVPEVSSRSCSVFCLSAGSSSNKARWTCHQLPTHRLSSSPGVNFSYIFIFFFFFFGYCLLCVPLCVFRYSCTLNFCAVPSWLAYCYIITFPSERKNKKFIESEISTQLSSYHSFHPVYPFFSIPLACYIRRLNVT